MGLKTLLAVGYHILSLCQSCNHCFTFEIFVLFFQIKRKQTEKKHIVSVYDLYVSFNLLFVPFLHFAHEI